MLLVTGAAGFLGTTLLREAVAAGRPVTGAFHTRAPEIESKNAIQADLTTLGAARALLGDVKPRWVVNCAGLANVDECESDPARARLLNVELPERLATECAKVGSRMVHFSTDSVFDGRRGDYTETDVPAPVNVYAETKLHGERAVLDRMPVALVIRTNFIGLSPTRRTGLADWLTARLGARERVSGFTDVIFGPLLTNDLARITLELMDGEVSGINHVAARDSVSKFEFARMLAAALEVDPRLVEPGSVRDASLTAPRPLNTSLSPARVEAILGRPMPSVADTVQGYVASRSETAALATRSPARGLD